MKTQISNPAFAGRRAQHGFTMVELMIALLIGLFLTAGVLTLVGAMKRTSTAQTGLSQLQDNERIAMSLLTDIIQSAGYYPNPVANTPSTFFTVTAVAPIFAAGQAITGTGTYSAAAPGDSISVRYTTAGNVAPAGNDGVMDCTGNTRTVQTTFTNTFSIDANGNLQCVLVVGAVTTTVQLVNGVTNLQIYYGVQTNPNVSNNSVDTYLDAAAVTAGNYWNKVLSVKVTLSFVHPLAGQPGQPPVGTTIPFTRVITLMNKTGVDS
jgi:type IV pilus assembly protein PilW